MTHEDRAIRYAIVWLRHCSAMIRVTPALWPLWWPVLHACETEAARLARHPQAQADVMGCEVIDLSEFRRRKAEAFVWRRHAAGGAA
jgi:hypothetical protein